GPRSSSGQPRRDVRGSTPELHHVLALEVAGKHADLGLRHAPDPPSRIVAPPRTFPGFDVFLGVSPPRLPIPRDVLALLHRSRGWVTSGRSSAERRPGGASHTAGTAFSNRIALAISPPEFSSPPSPSIDSSHRIDGEPSIRTR